MNVREIDKNGKKYVFVTRGRSKAFSDEEIEEFFGASGDKTTHFIPDDRGRRRLFLKDLVNGATFCSRKYGVTTEEVIVEAKRLAPHMIVKP